MALLQRRACRLDTSPAHQRTYGARLDTGGELPLQDPEVQRRVRSKLIPFAIQWGNWLQQRYAHISVSQQ